MQTQVNKSICRRFLETIFNDGELSAIWDYVAGDALTHELAALEGEGESPVRSREWLGDLVFRYRSAYPDLRLVIERQLAEGDIVVTCLRLRGTPKRGPRRIGSKAPSLDLAGVRIDRLAGGKIVESWFHLDPERVLRQVGALAAPSAAPHLFAPAARSMAVWAPILAAS